VPTEIIHEIQFFEYCDRRQLTEQDALDEPAEMRKRAYLIWSLHDARAKLERERRRLQSPD
jgi:hypothetical protein